MPSPQATEIVLTDAAQKGLEQLVRRHNVVQQIALRGRIILAAGQKQTNSAIATNLKVSIGTAQHCKRAGKSPMAWAGFENIPSPSCLFDQLVGAHQPTFAVPDFLWCLKVLPNFFEKMNQP